MAPEINSLMVSSVHLGAAKEQIRFSKFLLHATWSFRWNVTGCQRLVDNVTNLLPYQHNVILTVGRLIDLVRGWYDINIAIAIVSWGGPPSFSLRVLRCLTESVWWIAINMNSCESWWGMAIHGSGSKLFTSLRMAVRYGNDSQSRKFMPPEVDGEIHKQWPL